MNGLSPVETSFAKTELNAAPPGLAIPQHAKPHPAGRSQIIARQGLQTPPDDDQEELANELLRAMRDPNSRLDLHYQPLVNTKTERLVGFEALLRWTTKSDMIVSPPDILDIAENNDMAEALDLWVLQLAIISLSRWIKARPDLVMAVNMTEALLCSPQFMRMVAGLLHLHHVPAQCLCIEVTEELMLNPQILSNLAGLRTLGVKLALDDFGTGLSTVARLLDMQVDILKLDRSFIVGRNLSTRDEAFLAALVQMGHARGATVTIEGVSRSEDVAMARRIGCDTCQGYWYGRAVNAASAGALVMANTNAWRDATGRSAET